MRRRLNGISNEALLSMSGEQISIEACPYSLLLSNAPSWVQPAPVVHSGAGHSTDYILFYPLLPRVAQNGCIPCIRLPSFIFSQCEKGSRPVLAAGVNVTEAFYPCWCSCCTIIEKFLELLYMGDRAIYIHMRQENAQQMLKIAANQLKLPIFIEY